MAGTSKRDAYGLLFDYLDLDAAYERREEKIALAQAAIDEYRREQDRFVEEQERLTTILAPALRESGPVCWKQDDGTFIRIGFNPNEALLDVERLASPLSVVLPEPRNRPVLSDAEIRQSCRGVFTDTAIREAAAHQAFNDVADDDTGDFTPAGVGAAVAVIDQEAS